VVIILNQSILLLNGKTFIGLLSLDVLKVQSAVQFNSGELNSSKLAQYDSMKLSM